MSFFHVSKQLLSGWQKLLRQFISEHLKSRVLNIKYYKGKDKASLSTKYRNVPSFIYDSIWDWPKALLCVYNFDHPVKLRLNIAPWHNSEISDQFFELWQIFTIHTSLVKAHLPLTLYLDLTYWFGKSLRFVSFDLQC